MNQSSPAQPITIPGQPRSPKSLCITSHDGLHVLYTAPPQILTVLYSIYCAEAARTTPESHRSIWYLSRDPPSRPFVNLQKVEKASPAYPRRPFAAIRVPPTTFCCDKTLYFSPRKPEKLDKSTWFFYVFLENLTVVYRNLLSGCLCGCLCGTSAGRASRPRQLPTKREPFARRSREE